MTHRTWSACLLSACLLSAAGAQGARVPEDAVVARVDGAGITRQALERHLAVYYSRNGLERMIDASVIRQEGLRLKVSASDADVDARAAELKKAAGTGNEEALRGGVSEAAWREQVRSTILAEKVLDAKWPVKNTDLVRLKVRYARLDTERKARELIAEAKRGVDFELLCIRESLDGKENLGLVSPRPFLRVEHPSYFRVTLESGIRAGQVSPKPMQAGKFWLVLKLEGYYGPETLTGREREAAVDRIRASRAAQLIPNTRRRYRIEYPVTTARLVSEPRLADDSVMARVTLPDRTGKPASSETITRKALNAHLLEYAGGAALEQLVERSITDRQAAAAGAAVTDAEVTTRIETVKRATGTAFHTALQAEGITEEAWKERVRYAYLAEKTLNARSPVPPGDLVRLVVRYLRLGSRQEAEAAIRALQSGAAFEQLAPRSLDRGDGFVRPKGFLRAEQPELFKLLADAGVGNGQVLPQPAAAGSSFLVLRLEARLGPETLTGKERDDAIRRINALRLGPELSRWRAQARVEYPVPMAALIADSKS